MAAPKCIECGSPLISADDGYRRCSVCQSEIAAADERRHGHITFHCMEDDESTYANRVTAVSSRHPVHVEVGPVSPGMEAERKAAQHTIPLHRRVQAEIDARAAEGWGPDQRPARAIVGGEADEIARLRKENEKLRRDNDGLREYIVKCEHIEKDNERLQAQNLRLIDRLADVRRDLEQERAEFEDIGRQLDEMKAERDRLQIQNRRLLAGARAFEREAGQPSAAASAPSYRPGPVIACEGDWEP